MFEDDQTVVPKESGWFGSFQPVPDDYDDTPPIVPMKEQPLYVEDWIGLRELDKRGAVTQLTCPGPHMHLASECWKPLVQKYVGGKVSAEFDVKSSPASLGVPSLLEQN